LRRHIGKVQPANQVIHTELHLKIPYLFHHLLRVANYEAIAAQIG
jgi:hypothetical protein